MGCTHTNGIPVLGPCGCAPSQAFYLDVQTARMFVPSGFSISGPSTFFAVDLDEKFALIESFLDSKSDDWPRHGAPYYENQKGWYLDIDGNSTYEVTSGDILGGSPWPSAFVRPWRHQIRKAASSYHIPGTTDGYYAYLLIQRVRIPPPPYFTFVGNVCELTSEFSQLEGDQVDPTLTCIDTINSCAIIVPEVPSSGWIITEKGLPTPVPCGTPPPFAYPYYGWTMSCVSSHIIADNGPSLPSGGPWLENECCSDAP
jgi:hypothetical protein